MATREVYIDKMAAQLKKWSARLDVMESKAGSAAVKVKAGFIKQVKLLKEKEQAAVASLAKLKESTVDAGGEIAGGVKKAWDDFKEAMHSAGDKFNPVKRNLSRKTDSVRRVKGFTTGLNSRVQKKK